MDNRERLIHAAAELFQDQGFAHTSVEDLLDETGIARSNFYYHFDSKLDLAREVVERWAAAYRDAVSGSWSEAGSTDERRRLLFRLLRGSGSEEMLRLPIAALALELAPHDAEIRGSVADVVEDLERRFASLFDDGDRTDGDSVPRAATSTLMGALVVGHACREPGLSRRADEGLGRLLEPCGDRQRGNLPDGGGRDGDAASDPAGSGSSPAVPTGA